MGKGMFAWVSPVLRTHEQDLINLIGLDATVFLRVLRMCRNMFIVITAIGCGVLVPINLIKGQKFAAGNAISRVTPVNTFGNSNWGMVICAWLFNVIMAGFLWWNYRAILRLRRQYYDSLHARTLMVGQGFLILRSVTNSKLDQ